MAQATEDRFCQDERVRQLALGSGLHEQARDVVLDEIERWCVACLTHYPHVIVEG